MAPAQVPYSLYEANDEPFQVTLVSGTTPVNLTGCALTYVVQKYTSGSLPVITKTLAGGGILPVGSLTAGIVTIVIAAADTRGKAGDYVHELLLVDAAGSHETIFQGPLTIHPVALP